MGTLNKKLMAAVACGVIAFAASAFAQAEGGGGASGGAGGTGATTDSVDGVVTAGTDLGSTNSQVNSAQSSAAGMPDNSMNTLANNGVGVGGLGTSGPAGTTSLAAALATNPPGLSTGTNSQINSAQSSAAGSPDNSMSTLAFESVGTGRSEMNNDLGPNGAPATDAAEANAMDTATSVGGNAIDTSPVDTMTETNLAANGSSNSLGTGRPVGTTTGADAEATNPDGSAGINPEIDSAQSSDAGSPDNSANTLADESVGTAGSETNNDVGPDGAPATDTAAANAMDTGTSVGENAIDASAQDAMTDTNLAANGSSNSLGTRGPAGTTSVAAAEATNPGGAPVTGVGATTSSSSGGTALGGNTFRHRHVVTVRHVARNSRHHVIHVGVTTHPVNSQGYDAAMSGQIGVGSNAAFRGLDLGQTATPVRGLSARQMAQVNRREGHITSELNRAELQRDGNTD